MNYIAFQYAEALFSLAKEKSQTKEVVAEFKVINDAFDTEIYQFLIHPKIKKQDKKDIIAKSINNDLFKRFVFVLIDNSRIELLEDTLVEFEKLIDNQNRTMKVQAFSHKKLSSEQLNQLATNLEKKHNRKIELENIVDRSIVGGLRIEFEGMILDDTINNYLHSLKANLTKWARWENE